MHVRHSAGNRGRGEGCGGEVWGVASRLTALIVSPWEEGDAVVVSTAASKASDAGRRESGALAEVHCTWARRASLLPRLDALQHAPTRGVRHSLYLCRGLHDTFRCCRGSGVEQALKAGQVGSESCHLLLQTRNRVA